jgi:hypothetical protein
LQSALEQRRQKCQITTVNPYPEQQLMIDFGFVRD